MTSWKTYRLGDVISIKSGFAYKGEYLGKGDKYLLGMGCVSFNEKFLPSGARLYSGVVPSRYFVKAGDIVLATRQQSDNLPILGMPAIIPSTYKNTFVGANLYAVQNDSDIDNNYLYWLLKTPEYIQHIKSCQTGTTVRMITKSNIESFEFKCPNRIERNRISNFLWSLENKIENNRRINTNLELQAQALYKQWFVDFEFPNEEGKPYKSSGGKMVDSELGLIPEGWRVQTISNISVRIASGGTPKSLNESYYNGEIKWFTTKELKDCFLIDSEKHISTEALNDSAAKLFPKNTILMAIYAAPTVGRLGILTTESTFNQAAVGIIAKEEIGHIFVYLALLAERENLNNLASGAAQQNLNVGIVKQYKLIVPTEKLLIEFNQIAGSLFESIEEVSNENKTLATLRDTLLPKLMNGEIKM